MVALNHRGAGTRNRRYEATDRRPWI